MASNVNKGDGLSVDFWKFWVGQAISTLGSSFTAFALPLLVYKLTGSAINLAITSAATFLPYLLFGLIIGAWADRVDRKRMMIYTDIGRAVIIATIPLFAFANALSIWWIYVVGSISSTLSIIFDTCEFAAIPSIVKPDDIVAANGRLEASYSATRIIGPPLAGLVISFLPIQNVLLFDAASFIVSAGSLAIIGLSFNLKKEVKQSTILADMREGLQYVLKHPVLRNISLMMAMVNFVSSTTGAEFVLFAQQRLGADDFRLGLLYSAASFGIIVLSLLAGPLRKRFSFSRVALTSLMLDGVMLVALAFTTNYLLGMVLWAVASGLGILFNINTSSLRQAIVPNEMLGRVRSIAGVLAWSAIPVGTYLGGVAIETTHNVVLVYAVIGVVSAIIPVIFAFTALGHAEDYLPKKKEEEKAVEPAIEPDKPLDPSNQEVRDEVGSSQLA